jgi:hypothetical protein
VGGWVGKIVIPMPEALSFAESRRQKSSKYQYWYATKPPKNRRDMARHFKTEPTETVALFWISENTVSSSQLILCKLTRWGPHYNIATWNDWIISWISQFQKSSRRSGNDIWNNIAIMEDVLEIILAVGLQLGILEFLTKTKLVTIAFFLNTLTKV